VRYRQLGDSGLTVSVVGLGCTSFGRRVDLAGTRAVVGAALEAGITLFDTADIYGGQGSSERLLGEVLRGRRDEVVLATKFGADMAGATEPGWAARGSRRYVRMAVEASLRRLRTDHIDLYQLHEPDPGTPIEETLSALDDLVHVGKVRFVGSSNLTAWQIADADWTARAAGITRFVSAQNEYSLLERGVEAEIVPACEHFGIGLLPYFPLSAGLLTGKYSRGRAPVGRLAEPGYARLLTDAALDRVEALRAYAQERGRTLLDVAVGGLAAQPAVTSVISGATRPEQVRANVAAGEWKPTAADLEALDAVVPNHRGPSRLSADPPST
jgi:aryl-alcohol dehydrogenase-like predicted oxidoreductase